jgi:hypothetical protein
MILKDYFENFFKNIPRIFYEYFPKVVTKAIKKQVGVIHVIPFAPFIIYLMMAVK